MVDDLVEELPGTVSTRVVAKDDSERLLTWLSRTLPTVVSVGCPRWSRVNGLESGREREVRLSLTDHGREEARHSLEAEAGRTQRRMDEVLSCAAGL